jgi:acetolactate synthase I/II/III large subunit
LNLVELETAVRLGLAITVLVRRDGKYVVIQRSMDTRLGRHFGIDFGNPDFVAYGRASACAPRRIERADHLFPALKSSLESSAASLSTARSSTARPRSSARRSVRSSARVELQQVPRFSV